VSSSECIIVITRVMTTDLLKFLYSCVVFVFDHDHGKGFGS